MRLMLCDVKVPDAESEVDGIEILERCREVRKVEREKGDGENDSADRDG
jgi:hypothetical protein